MSEKKIAGLFNNIARKYDFLNHFLSAGLDIYWRHRLARLLPAQPAPLCIDVAAGTMDVSLALQKHLSWQRPRIFACDFSWNMLQQGKKKNIFPNLLPILGDGTNLPFPPNCADILTIAFGLRNIPKRKQFYAESLRVLKPGGKLYILEFGGASKAIWKGIYNFYLCWILPALGQMFSHDPGAYRYLADTIHSFPLARELATEIHAAGFEQVGCFPMTDGIVWIHTASKPKAPGASILDVCPDK